jgi:plastocyanin domain-containing protein
MKKLGSIIIIILFIGLVIGVFLLSKRSIANNTQPLPTAANNIQIEDGTQVISINAKGGYTPRKTIAQANTPTILKIKTNSTFDCSASLVIPSIGYKNNLPSSGETIINIPPQKSGSTLKGLCSMGMYSFTINFN